MQIDKKLIDRLPVYFALPCSLMNQEMDYRNRLDGMFNVAELAARFEVAVLLSELNLNSGDSRIDAISAGIERPSFGKWIEMLRLLSKSSPATEKYYKDTLIFLTKLSPIRNQKAHTVNFLAKDAEQALIKNWKDFIKLLEQLARPEKMPYANNYQAMRGIAPDFSKLTKFHSVVLGEKSQNRLDPILRWGLSEVNGDKKYPQCYASSKRISGKKKLQLIYDCFDSEFQVNSIKEDNSESFSKYFNLNPTCLSLAKSEFFDLSQHSVGSLKDIHKWLDDDDSSLGLIIGSAGSGKSSLLACVALNPGKKIDGERVVYHRFSPGTSWFSWDAFKESLATKLKCKIGEWPKSIDATWLILLDGLDLLISYQPWPTTVQKEFEELMKSGGRWLLTAPEGSKLSKDFQNANTFRPPILAVPDIRIRLNNLRRDIADKIFRQDKDSLDGEKVINPFINAVAKQADGNPLWLQLLCEDLEADRLNPYNTSVKDLPRGLEGYAINAQEELNTQRRTSDLFLKRQTIKLGKKARADLYWLDYCEKEFDNLLNKSLPSRQGVVAQPTWPMDNPPKRDSSNQAERDQENDRNTPTVLTDEGGCSFDILAWYSPLHFNAPERYGIYLPAEGIAHLADKLKNMWTGETDQLNPRQWMYWAAHVLYLHELGHAFIERLVYAMEPNTGKRKYENAAEKYKGLVLMEEALSNTFVCGMHRKMMEDSFVGEFSELTAQSEQLHRLLIRFMRQQPMGYRDFKAIEVEPLQSDLFIENCKSLLDKIYDISPYAQITGIDKIFHDVEVHKWTDSWGDIDKLSIYSLDNTGDKNLNTSNYQIPWKTPVYFLSESPTLVKIETPWLVNSLKKNKLEKAYGIVFVDKDDGDVRYAILKSKEKLYNFMKKYKKQVKGYNALSLLKFKKLQRIIFLDDLEMTGIINKHLNNGRRDIWMCQDELQDIDRDDYACF